MKFSTRLPLMLLFAILSAEGCDVYGQVISRAEYFFDTDPGPGYGTPLPVPAPAEEVDFTTSISTAGLQPGYHILFIRTRSSDDHWSLYEQREFVIEASSLQTAEYFFDLDPGVGNGIPLTVSAGQLSFSRSIATTGLSDGEHVLFIRTKLADQWSLAEPMSFYIKTKIVEAEYFIDNDPGLDNGNPIAISRIADEINVTATIGVGNLSSGVHNLFVRTKDVFGNWSLYEVQNFTVDPALPVELVDLQALVTEDQDVLLTWKTLSENVSHYFSAMHSQDGKVFSEFTRIEAAGESRIPRNYSAVDNHPNGGNNYYQLKMVDLDGQTSLSKIVVARIEKAGRAEIYPNPVRDQWIIDFSRDDDKGERIVDLVDMNGSKKFSVTTNQRVLHLTRDGLPSGTYLLKITAGRQSKFYKISFE